MMNKWLVDGEIVKSETRPDGEFVYPLVSYSRVRGVSYTPYRRGSDEWRKAANRALASEAQANFERNNR